MAMAQAAYSNNASTIYQGRSDRFIDDVLAAPMHAWQMNLGYLVGGAFRALLIGGALAALAVPITGAPVEQPAPPHPRRPPAGRPASAPSGTIVGIYAESFDHTSFINNIVILPLTFLGGVFYSVDRLGSPLGARSPTPTRSSTSWTRSATASWAPRTSAPRISFAVLAAMSLALLAWSQYLFTSGRKLKP